MSIPLKHDLWYWKDLIGTKADAKRAANKYLSFEEALKETIEDTKERMFKSLPTDEEFNEKYKEHFKR